MERCEQRGLDQPNRTSRPISLGTFAEQMAGVTRDDYFAVVTVRSAQSARRVMEWRLFSLPGGIRVLTEYSTTTSEVKGSGFPSGSPLPLSTAASPSMPHVSWNAAAWG